MDHQTLISYAQNAEDIVLWRTLRHVTDGRYVEVGANDHTRDSVSRLFYDHGWHGLEVEPVTAFAESFRAARPRDTVVQAAVTDADVEEVTLHVFPDTGLSTLDDEVSDRHRGSGFAGHDEAVRAVRLDRLLEEQGYRGRDVHFLMVDVEGTEESVLRSVDLSVWRPWVLLIEAVAPLTGAATHQAWEHLVLSSGYRFCQFDGVSRFYVAEEHAEALQADLTRPRNVLDDYRTHREVELLAQIARQEADLAALVEERRALDEEIVRWRSRLVGQWASTLAQTEGSGWVAGGGGGGREVTHLREELAAMQATVSWRVTGPLRKVRARQRGTR